MILKLRFVFLLLLFIAVKVSATHNRAGEITYKWIGSHPNDFTYEVTITTYTKTSSTQADRPQLDSVFWGDGTQSVFVRINFVDLPNDIRRNIYVNTHTYIGNGEFIIRFTDPNRNRWVVNIPNSVDVPFYIESTLIINPALGHNNSPFLTYPPIDQGCINRIFIHNPGAFDPDGDSLSYELTECGGVNGSPIPGYTFPSASNIFSLDSRTGELFWDSPILHVPLNQDEGCNCNEYNVAFNIIEWRHGYVVGITRRDMQIIVKNCDDFPPVVEAVTDTCVLAGDTLTFDVTGIDPDGDIVVLSASGGPMDGSLVPGPATFTPIIPNNDTVVSQFSWITQCQHIRTQPYLVLFRAASGSSPTLVGLKSTSIRVIAPPPPTLTAVPNASFIDLSWTAAPCGNVIRYNIYRRNGMAPDTIECPCDNGVPASTGFVLIGSTTDGITTTFTDNNNGQGLTIGIEYCYLVTAVYAGESESCASPQACASLKKDSPVITHADVRFTDVTNGSVYVGWSKPTELDTIQFPGPYEYRVFRSPGFFGGAFTTSPVGVFGGINDTIFIDTLIDTRTQSWSYKIEFYFTDSVTGDLTYKGQTSVASTIFLSISPTDNRLNLSWEEHVPWNNSSYDVFRQNPSLAFDSIATVNVPSYSDTGLVNGNTYCYFIRSSGSYSFSGFIDPILNRSQQACEIPVDNINPCPPDLLVNSYCDDDQNELIWTNPNNTCADDVLKYYIYFAPSEESGFELIDSVVTATDTTYIHDNLDRLSGCYKVTAIDSVGNETIQPEIVCVDTCRQYVLPSAFTPDGDGKNDFFHPCDQTTAADLQAKNCPPYKNVDKVDMKIYNRWGNIVFETTDKDINWDGKSIESKQDCSDGVYFYTCEVFFFSVKQAQSIKLNGTIQLIR